MKKICRMMTVTLLTFALAFSGIFAQVANSGNAVAVYGAQKLLYLNRSYVNIVPGDAYKLNLYSGKKNVSAKAKWTSSKPGVVKVNKKGRIKAKDSGKAVITATYGDKSIKCTVTSAYKNYEELYHDTLNAMYNRINGWDDSSDALAGGFVGIAEYMAGATGEEALEKIGYAIMDINGDAVPELIVTGITKRGPKLCFADDVCLIYTYYDKKSVEVASGWARNCYRLMDNGNLYYIGSSGAAYTYFGEFTLNAGEKALSCVDFYFSSDEKSENGDIEYYHNTTGYADISTSEHGVNMSADYFWNYNDAYEKRVRRIEVTPFSDFAVDVFSSASKEISIYDSTAGYEEYYEFAATDSEYKLDVVIAANSKLTDFKVSKITWNSSDTIFTPVLSDEPLYALDQLTPDKPLKLTIVFMGDLPEYALTFKDKDGVEKCYAIEQSGKDGSILITDL